MGLDGVCILDKDPGRSELFSDFLKKEGIDTIVVDNIERFATSSFGQDFMMILIDYLTIVKARRDAVLDFFKRLSSGNIMYLPMRHADWHFMTSVPAGYLMLPMIRMK